MRKRINNNSTLTINRLCVSVGVKTQSALAEFLGVRQGNISQAIKRSYIPDVWLYKVAYRTGRRVEWLQSGQGPEFADVEAEEKAKYRRAFPPALQGLIDQWTDLSEAERSIVDSAMKLLLSSDAETRDLVVKVVESVREHRKFQRQQRASTPKKKAAGSA